MKGSEGGGVFLNVERRRIFLTSREEMRKGRARQYEKQLGKGYFFLLFSRCNRGKNNVGLSLSGTLLAFEKCVHRLKVLIAQEMSPSPTMPYSVLTVQTFQDRISPSCICRPRFQIYEFPFTKIYPMGNQCMCACVKVTYARPHPNEGASVLLAALWHAQT